MDGNRRTDFVAVLFGGIEDALRALEGLGKETRISIRALARNWLKPELQAKLAGSTTYGPGVKCCTLAATAGTFEQNQPLFRKGIH